MNVLRLFVAWVMLAPGWAALLLTLLLLLVVMACRETWRAGR